MERLGSKEGYKRLLKYEKDTCLNTLYSLEGAIRGVRWYNFSTEIKNELKEFFDKENNR